MNNEIPFGFDPGSTHFSQQHLGPQLTEYTGNRIATALERIADALGKPKEAVEAHGYLSRMFKNCAPQCEPLPDLLGVCTQIDNLIAGYRIKTGEHKAPYPLGDPAPADPTKPPPPRNDWMST